MNLGLDFFEIGIVFILILW